MTLVSGKQEQRNSPDTRHRSLTHVSTYQGHRKRTQVKKPRRCKSKKPITFDPNFTFHGGNTEIHSKLDSNGPTHKKKPAMLLKYEQVAFSAYFGHFTQRSKRTGLDQILFKSTNLEPCRCVLEWSNLAHFPTGQGEVANLSDSSQDLQRDPKVQWHLLRATTSNAQRADGKLSLC